MNINVFLILRYIIFKMLIVLSNLKACGNLQCQLYKMSIFFRLKIV